LNPLSNEKGLALLLVLVVVALLAALVSDFAFSTLVDLRLAETFRDTVRASSLARGGITVGRELLRQDNNGWDAPGAVEELWSTPMENIPVGGGYVSLRIADLDGRLPLNLLVDSRGNPDVVMTERFRRLCEQLGLGDPDSLTDALLDWLDPDDEPRPAGAETSYYLGLSPPYPAANAPLDSLDELARVKGFTVDMVGRLRPFVTAHGERKLNVNSAPLEVLLAWDQEMTLEAAETVVAGRARVPYKTLDQLKEAVGVDIYSALNRNLDLTVSSRYFHISSQAEVGDGVRRLEAVVDRTRNDLIWQKVN